MPYGVRQDHLLRRWGFSCECALCTASPEELDASDDRLSHIEEIRKEVFNLGKKGGMDSLRKAISLNEELLPLAEEEGLPEQVAETYHIQAWLYEAIGERKKARHFAGLVLSNMEEFGAPEKFEHIKTVEDVLRNI